MDTDFDFEPVRARLIRTLEEKDISMLAASKMANLGDSYLSGVLKDGKIPKVNSLAAICSALGISMAYALYGTEMDQESEEIIKLLVDNPDRRQGILSILRS